jgi:hypothetical protein
MLRSSALPAIALSLGMFSLAATPAAAFSHASTIERPVELPAGQLPLPPRVPKVLPQYCETHNCIMPPRPGRDR